MFSFAKDTVTTLIYGSQPYARLPSINSVFDSYFQLISAELDAGPANPHNILIKLLLKYLADSKAPSTYYMSFFTSGSSRYNHTDLAETMLHALNHGEEKSSSHEHHDISPALTCLNQYNKALETDDDFIELCSALFSVFAIHYNKVTLPGFHDQVIIHDLNNHLYDTIVRVAAHEMSGDNSLQIPHYLTITHIKMLLENNKIIEGMVAQLNQNKYCNLTKSLTNAIHYGSQEVRDNLIAPLIAKTLENGVFGTRDKKTLAELKSVITMFSGTAIKGHLLKPFLSIIEQALKNPSIRSMHAIEVLHCINAAVNSLDSQTLINEVRPIVFQLLTIDSEAIKFIYFVPATLVLLAIAAHIAMNKEQRDEIVILLDNLSLEKNVRFLSSEIYSKLLEMQASGIPIPDKKLKFIKEKVHASLREPMDIPTVFLDENSEAYKKIHSLLQDREKYIIHADKKECADTHYIALANLTNKQNYYYSYCYSILLNMVKLPEKIYPETMRVTTLKKLYDLVLEEAAMTRNSTPCNLLGNNHRLYEILIHYVPYADTALSSKMLVELIEIFRNSKDSKYIEPIAKLISLVPFEVIIERVMPYLLNSQTNLLNNADEIVHAVLDRYNSQTQHSPKLLYQQMRDNYLKQGNYQSADQLLKLMPSLNYLELIDLIWITTSDKGPSSLQSKANILYHAYHLNRVHLKDIQDCCTAHLTSDAPNDSPTFKPN